MRFVPEEKPSFFSDTGTIVKILFVVVICIAGFLLFRTLFKKNQPSKHDVKHDTKHNANQIPVQPPTTSTSLRTSSVSLPSIHIGIHAYRCASLSIAQTIFGAFEAAKYPSFVHVHIYQELASQETQIDAYEMYRKHYLDQHTHKMDYLQNIHVKNANAVDSAGPLVGFMLLAKDMILPSMASPMDQCVFVRPFYESTGTNHVYGVTFVQDYDQALRSHDMANGVYSMRLCRTVESSDAVLSQLEAQASKSTIGGIIMQNVAMPLLKTTLHGINLPHVNVCTLDTWNTLIEKQAGFTAWSTLDRCMKLPSVYARTKKSAKVPVPFAIFRKFNDTREVRDVHGELQKDANIHKHVLPTSAVHEDIMVLNIQTLNVIMQKALSSEKYIKAIPYHAYTLMISNLVGTRLFTMNHIPVAIIADHERGSYAKSAPSSVSIKNTMAYRPVNWKRVPRIRKVRRNKKARQHPNQQPIIDLVPCNDFNILLPLDHMFMNYAQIKSDNITIDAFLGITSTDTPQPPTQTLLVKFGSPENLARRFRMLGGS
jgi:hypothetical protein